MIFRRKTLKRLLDEARDEALERGYKYGYLMGQIEKSNYVHVIHTGWKFPAGEANEMFALNEAQQIVDQSGF